MEQIQAHKWCIKDISFVFARNGVRSGMTKQSRKIGTDDTGVLLCSNYPCITKINCYD
jgi:hypothetical protein